MKNIFPFFLFFFRTEFFLFNKFQRRTLTEFPENMVKMGDILKAALIRNLFDGKFIEMQKHTGVSDTLPHGKMRKTLVHNEFEFLTECTAAHGTRFRCSVKRNLTIRVMPDKFKRRKNAVPVQFQKFTFFCFLRYKF